jgi:hypothetical protein
MTRVLLIALLAAGTLAATACIEVRVNTRDDETVHPSGDIVTRTFDLRDFDTVRIASTFNATIAQGDDYLVEVRVDRNIVDHLDVDLAGARLTIALDGDINLRGRFTLEAHITLPALRDVQVTGASRATIAGIDDAAGELDLSVSGASELEGDAAVESLRADISGASRLTLEGAAELAYIEASGASTLRLAQFALTELEIELSGASNAEVAVAHALGPVRLSGASSLIYAGDPTLSEVQTSGASTVAPR